VYVGLPGEIAVLSLPGASLYCPSIGGTLSGTSVDFCWTSAGAGAEYELDVSDKLGPIGQGDIFVTTTTALSEVVSDLPCDGRTIYVQLATNGQTPTRRYTYTACQMLHMTASPTTLPAAGGTVTFTGLVSNLTPATQTFVVYVWRNLPPWCHTIRLGFGYTTVCTPEPSIELASTTVTLAPGASAPFGAIWGTGALVAGESGTFSFSATASTPSGTELDSVSVNVTQN
jgi:hypothetical protein